MNVTQSETGATRRQRSGNRHQSRINQTLGVYLCLSLALLAGCTSWDKTPKWVDNPKAVYPEGSYLVAVGEGDSRRTAENAAAANLARIFEARIESVESLSDTSHETDDLLVRTTDFSTDINVLSAQTLFNIQHAEAWRGDNGRVHAVAYLDRRETAAIYRGKIDELTARVRFLEAQAKASGDPLKQYASLRTAMRLVGENKVLLRQLNVIHPASASGATPGYAADKIRKALADKAKNIRVRIAIDGDTDNRMATVIEELITRYGFVAGEPGVLNIAGRVGFGEARPLTANLVAVRYSLALQVKNAEGTVLISVSEKGREAHVSPAEARIRAFRTLEAALKAGASKRLDAYFDSLVDPMPNH